MFKLYYKSVNRGLSFTKPGLYTIGFIMAIGLLAIITGINGFYIFMSTGLSLLIISGLISERVMYYNKVTHLESVASEANHPFNLNFTVHNSSPSFTTYGIETSFTLEKPGFHFIARPVEAPISGKALKIGPGLSAMFHARCDGLPRGYHEKIYVAQRTNYPFGFLEKFKILELPCSLAVTPEIDQALLAALRADISRRKALADADREFFSHQAYTHKEPLKHIDWKRSAGKPPKDWVVKQFRSEVQNFHYIVSGPWQHALNAGTESAYETFLTRLATAVKALSTELSEVGLDTGNGPVIWSPASIQLALASAPVFAARSSGVKPFGTDVIPQGRCITLVISPDSFTWLSESGQEAV